MPSDTDAASEAQRLATELLMNGRIAEASMCLSEAIQRGESADLWNDWAAVQLGVAEKAFRLALKLEPSHPDATANLAFLLFILGKRDQAAELFQQALSTCTGMVADQVRIMLRLCTAGEDERETESEPAASRLRCNCGKSPLVQRGQRMGRSRDRRFFQAMRCQGCGFMSFEAPRLEFLAEYYKGEYHQTATSWYNAEDDYDPVRTESRAQDVLHYVERYIDRRRPLLHECGCSFGGTVARLQSLGYQATGTDLNSSAILEGSQKGNKWIFAESEADFFRRNQTEFQAIYLYHALEHMPSPVDFLLDVRRAVEKDGIVFIAVPNSVNYFSLAKSFLHNSWFAYPDHLNYFSPGSLPCLARAAGYAVLEFETRALASTDADAQTLLACKPDSYEWRLIDRLIQQAFLGHELRFVLTPEGSIVAHRFPAQIHSTQAMCEHAKQQEVSMLDLCAQ